MFHGPEGIWEVCESGSLSFVPGIRFRTNTALVRMVNITRGNISGYVSSLDTLKNSIGVMADVT